MHVAVAGDSQRRERERSQKAAATRSPQSQNDEKKVTKTVMWTVMVIDVVFACENYIFCCLCVLLYSAVPFHGRPERRVGICV